MVKIGGRRTRIHDNTLTFSELAQQLANHYDLDDSVYVRIDFMYTSYRERGGDKKSIFLSGDG